MKKLILSIISVMLVAPMAMAYVPPKRVHPEVSYETFKMHHTMRPQVGKIAPRPADGKSNLRWCCQWSCYFHRC